MSLATVAATVAQHNVATVGNSAPYGSAFAVISTDMHVVGDTAVNSFVSSLSNDQGVLGTRLAVSGHHGLPVDGQLIQAALLRNDSMQAFLGSNRSDASGVAYLALKVRRPPGLYQVQLSAVKTAGASVQAAYVRLHIRPCVYEEIRPAPDACEACQEGRFSFDPESKVCTACPPG